MPLKMPEPDLQALAQSPLALVVCQVKVEENLLLAEPNTALRLKALLPDRYSRLTRAAGQQMQLIQRAGGEPIERVDLSRQMGHRLATQDGSWIVSLGVDSFAIETTDYTTWDDTFGPRLEELLRAISEVVNPVLEARVGLRYVNVLRGSQISEGGFSAPKDFDGWIAPWLLGPLSEERFAGSTSDVDGRSVLALEGGGNLVAKYGTVLSPDEEMSFLLDLDAFREEGLPFDVDGILTVVQGFNRTITSFFQQSFTEAGLKKLKGE